MKNIFSNARDEHPFSTIDVSTPGLKPQFSVEQPQGFLKQDVQFGNGAMLSLFRLLNFMYKQKKEIGQNL